jgi:hypothetical protein
MKREIFERYVIQVASVTINTPTWLHVSLFQNTSLQMYLKLIDFNFVLEDDDRHALVFCFKTSNSFSVRMVGLFVNDEFNNMRMRKFKVCF